MTTVGLMLAIRLIVATELMITIRLTMDWGRLRLISTTYLIIYYTRFRKKIASFPHYN